MNEQPVFSIIIPTYDRPQQLAICLTALTRLDYPRDRFEVIIVDDGSPSPLDAVVAPFKQQLAIKLIRQTNAGPATARNDGADRAQGQFLAFTDDDCQPGSNWLQALTEKFSEFPAAVLGGQTVNQLTNNIYAIASQLLLDYIYGYYNSDFDRSTFFASNNLAIAAEQFQLVGRFDRSFPLAAAEDREFCDRCLNLDRQLVYVPSAQISHAHHLTLVRFSRQHFNYGRGAFHFHKIRSQRNLQQIKVEPLTFYFQLLSYPLRDRSLWIGLLLSSLLFLSQVANVAGFFYERFKRQ
jgi:glycosyltransferase involved in cell wall biosynthesis